MMPKMNSLNYSVNISIVCGIEVVKMTMQDKNELYILLNEYSDELAKTCKFDCYNCDLGILESYYDMHTCAIDTVIRKLAEDNN